jgi:surfactin synthase thioesterase subunit
MAGGRGKIHEHPNAGINNFRQRPQDINRKGIAKKSYNVFIENQKAQGVENVNKQNTKDMVSILFSMTQEQLIEVAKDPDMPFSIRAVINGLMDPATRQRELADWRDWAFGKADQDVNLQNTIISPTLKVEFTDD